MMFKKILLKASLVTALVLGSNGVAVAHGYPSDHLWRPIELAQSELRSRSEVIAEVKRRYRGAEVLRIDYDESREVYKVRVLMPSGKVRKVTVSARR